jgi:electron transfer flavoprotein beta subunit
VPGERGERKGRGIGFVFAPRAPGLASPTLTLRARAPLPHHARTFQDQLRTALALGADRAIHVPLGTSDADPAPTPGAVAAILAALIQREEGPHPGLVLFGKQAIDDDASAVGPLVAAALGWPQATFASRVVVGGDGRGVTVTREVDGGLQTVWAPLPAVVTADLRLNTPRFPSLPAIMKAKKRAIESVGVGELGPGVAAAVSGAPQVVTVRVDPPPPRPPGVMVGSAGELVAALVKAGRLPVG